MKRISLKEYGGFRGLQDREDIIKYLVNMEDKAEPYKHEIPEIELPPRPKFTTASLYAYSKNFILGLLV